MTTPLHAVPSGPDAATHRPTREEILGILSDEGGLGLWWTDTTGSRLEGTPAFHSLLGSSPGEVACLDGLADRFVPEDRAAAASLSVILRGGTGGEREVRVARSGRPARRLRLKGVPVPGDGAGPGRIVGILAEAEPHGECQDRFRALIEATASVVWVVSPDGRAIDMPQWQDLTAQDPAAFQGLGWIEAIHPADKGRTLAAWQTALSHDAHYNTDYRILCADGVYRWFNSRGVPVRNRDGTIREWVGLLLAIPGNNRFQPPGEGGPAMLDPSTRMVSPSQIRAARALVDVSAETLAQLSGLSVSTVRRMEDAVCAIQPRADNNLLVRRALEAHGVAFTFEPEGRPGVRHA